MYELMGRLAPVASIPEAHHHLILDQPLAFVAALRTLLSDWDHSTPRRRQRVGAHPVVALSGAATRPGHLTATDLAALDGAVTDVSAHADGAVGAAVPAAALVAAAAPEPAATHCTVIAAGGAYRASIPLPDLVDSGWLAFGLSEEEGGPFRLTVAAGRTLCWNVKQVAELRFTTGPEPDDVPEHPGH